MIFHVFIKFSLVFRINHSNFLSNFLLPVNLEYEVNKLRRGGPQQQQHQRQQQQQQRSSNEDEVF